MAQGSPTTGFRSLISSIASCVFVYAYSIYSIYVKVHLHIYLTSFWICTTYDSNIQVALFFQLRTETRNVFCSKNIRVFRGISFSADLSIFCEFQDWRHVLADR